MYLVDREIKAALPQLNFETDNPDYPFLPDEQIQPCSVDIRLCNVFWLPTKRKSTIDLRKSKMREVSPRRHWKVMTLKSTECITIRPGEIALGRTYEKFSIPTENAGKIEGRSSFARMGLSVHCAADFINPGWRGHMTLQLVNLGPHPIKIFPYLPVCQLILVKLSGTPDHLYGERELQSKYVDDDGGPSYWWRDKRIQALHKRLGEKDTALAIQQDVMEKIGAQDIEVIERFDHFMDKTPIGKYESSTVLLDRFAQEEDRKRMRDKLFRWLQALPFALLGSLSVKLLLDKPHGLTHYIVWAITSLSVPLAVRTLIQREGEYLGEKEMGKLKKI